jgi:hypothetical protein
MPVSFTVDQIRPLHSQAPLSRTHQHRHHYTTAPAATTHTVYYPGTSHLGLQPPSTKWRHVYTCECPTSLAQLLSRCNCTCHCQWTLENTRNWLVNQSFPLNLNTPPMPSPISAVTTLKRFYCSASAKARVTVLCTLLPSNVVPSQHDASQVQTAQWIN